MVGALETLLGIIYVYPFKCQLCGFRFRMPQWGVRYVRVPEDPTLGTYAFSAADPLASHPTTATGHPEPLVALTARV